MRSRWAGMLLLYLCIGKAALPGQTLTVHGRELEIHGFASQGFVYTNTNNWLTMNTSEGSAALTDMGLNISTNLTDHLRVGAQFYDRNLGHLGNFNPTLDWAVVDYRFTSWFGVRGGKVKTTLGLYNDSQDLDFLRVFALLPQSIYPTDIREATIAHLGVDIYGSIPLGHNLGEISYTVFTGHSSNSLHDGFQYVSLAHGLAYSRYGGAQYGADLRWSTPLKGLLIGASAMDQDLSGVGRYVGPPFLGIVVGPVANGSDPNHTRQFYSRYILWKLRIDSEYRHFADNSNFATGATYLFRNTTNVRGWYVSGTYHPKKFLAVGGYYSRDSITSISKGPFAALLPNETDTSLPANHVYDRVVSARFDINRFWNVKLEGHFMNGYGESTYPDGFYPQTNPQGFKPNTNALVIKTGVNF